MQKTVSASEQASRDYSIDDTVVGGDAATVLAGGAEGDSDSRLVTVGSRRSELALRQTHHVLRRLGPDCGCQFRIVHMDTIGDQILDRALSVIGDKGLFTRELDASLLSGQVSLVVHSLKDLPTDCPEGLAVPCILRRELPQDALVLSPRHVAAGIRDLASLPAGSVIGTSSLRRIAQLTRAHPSLRFQSVRGNLGTRWRKLNDPASGLDGLILAEAGLERMGWSDRLTCSLAADHCLPAVGQGALAVQCREDDLETARLLRPLLHRDSFMEAVAERSLLRAMEGGCSVPLGVRSIWRDSPAGASGPAHRLLKLVARVLSIDGAQQIGFEAEEPLTEDAEEEKNSPVAKRRRDAPANGNDADGHDSANGDSRSAAAPPERWVGLLYPEADARDRRHLAACVRLGRRVADGLLAAGAGPVLEAAKAAARAAAGKLAPAVPLENAQPSS